MNKNEKKTKTNEIQINHKKPLFKIFMDENSKKKLLIKSINKSNSKDSKLRQSNDEKFFKNQQLNLQLFSFKILEAKYNSTPELYLQKNLNILIKKKKTHLLAYFNEISICTGILKDYLKRYYNYKDSEERIPKYVSYYKNYLKFFCKPFFTDYNINKKMVKHMEKIAQEFYNENYADEDNEEEAKNKKEDKNKKPIQIFSKKITEDIENCDVCTIVTSEAAMKQIQLINKNVIKNNIINKNNNMNNDINVQNNNKNPVEVKQLTIIDNDYKITPIYDINDEKQKNKIISEMKKSNEFVVPITNDSISLIVDELENKEKNNIKLDNENINNEESLEKTNKENDILKQLNNNCIFIQGGKTTNNINININHYTIGQKIIPQNGSYNKLINELENLKNINNNNFSNKSNTKIIKKLKHVGNSNSLVNLKDKNNTSKATNGYDGFQIKSNIKEKNKSSSMTLPPTQNMLSIYHPNLSKKFTQIFPNTINNQNHKKLINLGKKPNIEVRNPSILREGFSSGPMTNLHKDNIPKEQLGKFTIYTNNANYLKNFINKINYGTMKVNKNKKIIYNKNMGILSGERSKSTNNKDGRTKKVFNSALKIKRENIHLLFKNNFGSNRKDNISFNSIKSQISKGKQHNEEIPLIPSKEERYSNINNKDIKVVEIKGKSFKPYKILNIAPLKKRAASTGK